MKAGRQVSRSRYIIEITIYVNDSGKIQNWIYILKQIKNEIKKWTNVEMRIGNTVSALFIYLLVQHAD